MTLIEYCSTVSAELINYTGNDESVARAAWVSNYAEDARTKSTDQITGLIRFLYRNKHMSPFEHGQFTFWVDCPIFVAREFHRHRTFSYNEVSGRYKELEPRFYVPDNGRPLVQRGKPGAYTFEPGDMAQYLTVSEVTRNSYHNAWNSYQAMLGEGVAREVARNVLPVGIYTQFYATCNPRNLMQFLTLRNDSHALAEIRAVAQDMEGHFKRVMPITHAVYAEEREKERANATDK